VPENKPSKRAEREQRLAAELRANLRKRKAQARTRQQQAEEGDQPGLSPAPDVSPAPDLRQPNPSVTS
jgi:hypothetical protein